ncbi:MAG: hypothetical protein RR744_10700 [Cellulosilyticaceae bacterium]
MPKVILKNKTGKIDVSQMVGDITWSGIESEIAKKLELNFLYPLHDHYTSNIYPNIGDQMYLYDEKYRYIGVVENKDLINLVGVFQNVYTKEKDKQAGTVASNMLRGIEQSVEITTLGNIDYRTGKIVQTEDSATKIVGLFDVISDSHSWENGQYVANLNLRLR